MSPLPLLSFEVIATVLALGSKAKASKKLRIPEQTITKLMRDSFSSDAAARAARVKFDTAYLKFNPGLRRNVKEFANALNKLMSPADIEHIKNNIDSYAGSQRFEKLLKALRSNRQKGYGLRLTTYQNPNRISLMVHRPVRRRVNAKKSNKPGAKKKTKTPIKKRATKKTTKKRAKSVSSNRRRSNKR